MMEWLRQQENLHWIELGISFGLRLLIALLVLLVGLRVVRFLGRWITKRLQQSRLESTTALFLGRIALAAMQVVVWLTVVQMLGVPLASMVAVLGAAGLAIGLALKDSLSNIASGVMLVTLKPFSVGDSVTINGMNGTVEMVNVFHTRLRGGDNQLITVPNSLITTDSIINHTPDTMRRIELILRVGYREDVETVRAVLLEAVRNDPRILIEPEPTVLVYELTEHGVHLGLRCYVGNKAFTDARCALNERIKLAFDERGIRMAVPKQDVQITPETSMSTPVNKDAFRT